MLRKFDFSTEEYYHIYNRGNEKRDIFLDSGDRKRFKEILYLCNSGIPVRVSNIKEDRYSFDRGDSIIDIGAYCLMPNHFHLLIREKDEGGVSKFMSKLATSYSMYFNTKYERTGTLFEGPFKAIHVNEDNYLKYLFAYIHLNPLKLVEPKWREGVFINRKKAEKFVFDYEDSSIGDYLYGDNMKESKILNKKVFPEYFSNGLDFEKMIKEWMDYEPDF